MAAGPWPTSTRKPELADLLADQRKVAQAVQLIISQTGVHATVVQPGEPLKDVEGKPLV